MPQWLNKLLGKKPPAPPRPSEIEFDERALELVGLGNKMFATEDYQGAREAYESALRIDGHCAEAWHRRGRLFLIHKDIPAALACYARSLELNMLAADAWCGLGEAILTFLKSDQEPIFIRENRIEIVSEAFDCFDRAAKIGGDLPKAREGKEICRGMLKDMPFNMATPRLFSFHSGGLLEKAKREFVSPFLKPSDYRRKQLPTPQDD